MDFNGLWVMVRPCWVKIASAERRDLKRWRWWWGGVGGGLMTRRSFNELPAPLYPYYHPPPSEAASIFITPTRRAIQSGQHKGNCSNVLLYRLRPAVSTSVCSALNHIPASPELRRHCGSCPLTLIKGRFTCRGVWEIAIGVMKAAANHGP